MIHRDCIWNDSLQEHRDILLEPRVTAPTFELLVYCKYEVRNTLGESAAVIPSVFDILSEVQVTTEAYECGRSARTFAFFAILSAQLTAVLSPGMGILSAARFAISSA